MYVFKATKNHTHPETDALLPYQNHLVFTDVEAVRIQTMPYRNIDDGEWIPTPDVRFMDSYLPLSQAPPYMLDGLIGIATVQRQDKPPVQVTFDPGYAFLMNDRGDTIDRY